MKKIKTLIVDDSTAYRKILSLVADSFDEIEIVATAPNGNIALKKLEQFDVSLVLLDLFMPEMDGVETLGEIRKKFPNILVILISGQTTRNADITVKALEQGAVDFILKPSEKDPEKNLELLKDSLKRVIQFVKIKINLQSFEIPTSREEQKKIIIQSRKKHEVKKFDLIAIASSTGGPEALSKIIPKLSGDLRLPVLLVQHMPPVFTKFLAESLNKQSPLTVVEAEDGQAISPGIVYVAPGGKHLTVKSNNNRKIIQLSDAPPENSCRPSADVLFRSLSSAYTNDILAIVLTGMGQDGLKGICELKKHRCYCITQSAKTCVVYGMPKAVVDAKLSDLEIDLDQIPFQIQSLVKGAK